MKPTRKTGGGRGFRPRLTKKQKAVVPCMMAALVRSENRSIEEIEAEMEGGRDD